MSDGMNQNDDVIERTLIKLWQVSNELSRIRPDDDRFRVTIFGSARMSEGEPEYREVRNLASKLSSLGCDIVTGGGPGLMQAANEGAQLGDPHNRTTSMGIRIDLPFEQGANPYVEEVYAHQTFFTRLHHFVRLSDAYVIVSGGIGTTLELMTVWQLLQVGHIGDTPLILVGRMWRELVAWARTHMTEGATQLAGGADVAIPIIVDDVDSAAEIIAERTRGHQRN